MLGGGVDEMPGHSAGLEPPVLAWASIKRPVFLSLEGFFICVCETPAAEALTELTFYYTTRYVFIPN